MQKFLTLLLLSLCILNFAQGIQFEESSFADLQAKAKKENKLIFIDAYTTWCGPCQSMAKEVFTQKSVGDHYNNRFINTKIDMEKGEGVTLAKKYKVAVYPTYIFINGDGELVHRTLGYANEKEFIQYAKDAEDPSRRLGALINKFDNGEKEPSFLKNLIRLTIYSEPEFGGKVLARYFQNKKGKPLNKNDTNLLLSCIDKADGEGYKIFKDRKKDVIKLSSAKWYNIYDQNFQMNSIIEKATNKGTKEIDSTYFVTEAAKIMGKEKAKIRLLRLKAGSALKDKNIATYEKLALEIYKNYTTDVPSNLDYTARNFLKYSNDKAALQQAIVWLQHVVKSNKYNDYMDTLANLYNKIGDKENAKIWATKSIEVAKKDGVNFEDTQKLLDSLK